MPIHADESHGKEYTPEQTSNAIGVCKATVYNILKKYSEEGIESVIMKEISILIMLNVSLTEEQERKSSKLHAVRHLKDIPDEPFDYLKKNAE